MVKKSELLGGVGQQILINKKIIQEIYIKYKKMSDVCDGPDSCKPATGGELVPEFLDLHRTLPTQVAVRGSKYVEIQPSPALGTTGKICFKIKTDTCQFLDVKNSYLVVTTQMVDSKDKPISAVKEDGHSANEKCRGLLVNGINHAWFKSCEVKINGTVVEHGDNMYAYRGDIEKRIGYSRAVKQGCLQLCGWIEEEQAFEDADPGGLKWERDFDNAGRHREFQKRFLMTENGKEWRTVGPIHADIFDQQKYLPDDTMIEVNFDREDAKFITLSKLDNADFAPRITSCYMMAKMISVDEDICKEMRSLSQCGNSYLYPERRVKMVSFNVSGGTQEINQSELTPGETDIPRRVFVCFVRGNGKSGSLKHDPFNYHHYNATSVLLKIGSEDRPLPEIISDFENGNTSAPLFSFLDAAGALFGEIDLGITPENYSIRNAIWGFNISNYGVEAFQIGEKKTMELKVRFKYALPHAIVCIVYCEYDCELQIRPDKKVILHSHA